MRATCDECVKPFQLTNANLLIVYFSFCSFPFTTHSWTGDAFVSQGTFYSFASDYSIPLQNLNDTSCEDCCEGIATYCVLFVLSSCEYFAATGDSNSFLYFVPMITSKLERAFQLYKDPEGLRFVGW